MRLPRHDTPLRLSAEPPLEGIARDEGLLEDGFGQRWWLPSSAAVVVGLGLHHRLQAVVELERARNVGMPVLGRKAGGGAVWLDEANMLCGAIAIPTTRIPV